MDFYAKYFEPKLTEALQSTVDALLLLNLLFISGEFWCDAIRLCFLEEDS